MREIKAIEDQKQILGTVFNYHIYLSSKELVKPKEITKPPSNIMIEDELEKLMKEYQRAKKDSCNGII